MVRAKTFYHTAHMRKTFLLLWIIWKGKNCHLQMLHFFCYLMWENFCHLKFCHNRINPFSSCSEAWTLVWVRWPTVYLPISIPHHFFPTPISFLEVVHYFSLFIFIVCSPPFSFWPQYMKSDNLRYNMMERWINGSIVPPSDGPMFILIEWE